MPTQSRILATLLLLHSLFGIAWIWTVGQRSEFYRLFVMPAGTIVLIGIAAAVGLFLGRRWGRWLGMLFYLIQVVDVWTAGFRWAFTLGLGFDVALGWIDEAEISVDLVSLAMLVWLVWLGGGGPRERGSGAVAGKNRPGVE